MDFFKQPLCIGDRVAFVTNKGVLQHAQIIEFIGNRFTTVHFYNIIKEPL